MSETSDDSYTNTTHIDEPTAIDTYIDTQATSKPLYLAVEADDGPAMRYRLLAGISYIGNQYNGFQKQPLMTSIVSIMDRIEHGLAAIGMKDAFAFSGSRTDAKIHAYSHPTVVEIHSKWPVDKMAFKQRMNDVFRECGDLISVADVAFVDQAFVFNLSVDFK